MSTVALDFSVLRFKGMVMDDRYAPPAACSRKTSLLSSLTENWTDAFIACFHKFTFVTITLRFFTCFACLRFKKMWMLSKSSEVSLISLWSINCQKKREAKLIRWQLKLIICLLITFWHTTLLLFWNLITLSALLFMTSCQGLVDSEATLTVKQHRVIHWEKFNLVQFQFRWNFI